MKCTLRCPYHFTKYNEDAIVSNFLGAVDKDIEAAIKGKPFYSSYAAWHFNGIIWWNDEIGYWCGSVITFMQYQASYLAETVEELALEMNADYGQGESGIEL